MSERLAVLTRPVKKRKLKHQHSNGRVTRLRSKDDDGGGSCEAMQNSSSADQHSLVYELQEPCYYSVLDVEPDARCAHRPSV